MFNRPAMHAAASLVVVLSVSLLGSGAALAACSPSSWPAFEQRLVAAQVAFQKRDPQPLLSLWSHAEDVSLFGANGGYEVGWTLVGARMARISAATTNGPRHDQVLVRTVGSDVAMIVQLENITNLKPDGSFLEVARLRVTHTARCEGSDWRIIHRHADPLVEPLPGKAR